MVGGRRPVAGGKPRLRRARRLPMPAPFDQEAEGWVALVLLIAWSRPSWGGHAADVEVMVMDLVAIAGAPEP